MTQVYNLSTWKAEARTLQVLGKSELYRRPPRERQRDTHKEGGAPSDMSKL